MTWIQIALNALYAITIIGIVFVVISENRNPIRTLAWVLVLLLLPAVGIVLFYFFGQDTHKKKKITDILNNRIPNKRFDAYIENNKNRLPEEYKTLSELLERSDNSWVLSGSKVEVINRGKRKFEALLNDLENATHHIHIQYFLFNNDHMGQRVKSVLIKKAEEGVSVRFLYDNVANIAVKPQYYNEMRKSGVIVVPFLKIKFPIFKTINYRNHRKIVVVDGKIGYMGGMNIGDEYADDAKWRDTHLRIIGHGVYGLQAGFLIDWISSGGNKDIVFKDCFPEMPNYTENLLQFAMDGPSSRWQNILLATVHSIICARKYVYIQTPYFLPTESLFEALQSAALSGIDIRLMVSKRSDSPYVDPAARSYYADLLKAGMRIYEHKTKFVHAKTLVCDDYLSVIGSANMDFRSLETNFEINCYLYDEKLALLNKQIFLEDLVECEEIIYEKWMKRPWTKKAIESILRLFSPLM